ncbi:uncharacterized protein LOC112569229 [Pomacea canaliculata]|uniref:uncharacterized protein LOC112569229 n=1 Tax=Pomacea canaliculata TaxID=400727 RepID=UPI000D739509|nr:uncharacterized protein LOC112569229 [Pomacea canaliculata]
MAFKARFVAFAVVYLFALPFCCQGQELYFNSFEGDTVCVSENSYLKLSFWFNVSDCTETITYRLSVKTKTLNGYEYDGRVLRENEKCVMKYNNSLRCVADDGPAELYKKINRSHVETTFEWSWKNCSSQKLEKSTRILKLNFSCNPENVTTNLKRKEESLIVPSKDNQHLFDKNNFSDNLLIVVVAGIVSLPVLIAAVVSILFRCRKKTSYVKDDKESLIPPNEESEDGFLGGQKTKDNDFHKSNEENITTLNQMGKPGRTMNPEVRDVIQNQRMIKKQSSQNLNRNLTDILHTL